MFCILNERVSQNIEHTGIIKNRLFKQQSDIIVAEFIQNTKILCIE